MKKGWLQEAAFRQRKTSLNVFGEEENQTLGYHSRSRSWSSERMEAEFDQLVQEYEGQEFASTNVEEVKNRKQNG